MSEDTRRGVHESASVTISDFTAALQGRYVPGTEALAYRVLDAARAQVAEAVVDSLVPGDDAWPAASATGAAAYLDATAFTSPGLRPLLLRALDSVSELARDAGGDLLELDANKREQVLASLEAADPSAFQMLLELTLEAYYRSDLIRRPLRERAGYRTEIARDGVSLPPFDLTLLERVGELPPRGVDL
jgi:hypothetical protein